MGIVNKPLNRRITFQALTTTPDSYGGNTEVYSSVAVIWAYRKQISSSKAVQFGIDLLTKAYDYEFRKDAFTPNKTSLIVDEGVKMHIVAIDEVDNGKMYVRVTAKEKE